MVQFKYKESILISDLSSLIVLTITKLSKSYREKVDKEKSGNIKC